MELLQDIIGNVWFQRIFWSIIVALVSLIIYRALAKFLDSREKKNTKIMSQKKNKTLIRMFKSIVGAGLAIMAALTILQIFGIDVTSMLAGVGIAGIVVGFALQDALKDIIRGFEIVSDNYYGIGDVIKYGNNVGQVLSVTLRTTKLQDINTMNIVSIANRNIDQVEIVSGYIYIPIPLSYDVSVEDAEVAMHDIVKHLGRKEEITSAKYQGVTAMAESSLNYQIVVTCDPMNQLQVRRDALRTIVTTLESHNMHIPYQQLDIHTGK